MNSLSVNYNKLLQPYFRIYIVEVRIRWFSAFELIAFMYGIKLYKRTT